VAREDAKKMKTSRLRLIGGDFGGQARKASPYRGDSDRTDVESVMVGQIKEFPSQY
jgi:hypothetical protein